jgi:PAS domain S-box-containing protein
MISREDFIALFQAMFGGSAPISSKSRQFVPAKDLCENDCTLIDMLNSNGHESVSFCISDPDAIDLPIIFASDGFCKLTGYSADEIEGKNCRFLQGSGTKQEDVSRIRNAIIEKSDASVNLLNYRKDGTPFVNEFFICPLHDSNSKLVYFIGIQAPVDSYGRGQMPKNPGWVYTQGNHV